MRPDRAPAIVMAFLIAFVLSAIGGAVWVQYKAPCSYFSSFGMHDVPARCWSYYYGGHQQ
jgi:hypothetical protein